MFESIMQLGARLVNPSIISPKIQQSAVSKLETVSEIMDELLSTVDASRVFCFSITNGIIDKSNTHLLSYQVISESYAPDKSPISFRLNKMPVGLFTFSSELLVLETPITLLQQAQSGDLNIFKAIENASNSSNDPKRVYLYPIEHDHVTSHVIAVIWADGNVQHELSDSDQDAVALAGHNVRATMFR